MRLSITIGCKMKFDLENHKNIGGTISDIFRKTDYENSTPFINVIFYYMQKIEDSGVMTHDDLCSLARSERYGETYDR